MAMLTEERRLSVPLGWVASIATVIGKIALQLESAGWRE